MSKANRRSPSMFQRKMGKWRIKFVRKKDNFKSSWQRKNAKVSRKNIPGNAIDNTLIPRHGLHQQRKLPDVNLQSDPHLRNANGIPQAARVSIGDNLTTVETLPKTSHFIRSDDVSVRTARTKSQQFKHTAI